MILLIFDHICFESEVEKFSSNLSEYFFFCSFIAFSNDVFAFLYSDGFSSLFLYASSFFLIFLFDFKIEPVFVVLIDCYNLGWNALLDTEIHIAAHNMRECVDVITVIIKNTPVRNV